MVDLERLDRDVADRCDLGRLRAGGDLGHVALGAHRRQLFAVVGEAEARVGFQRLPVAGDHALCAFGPEDPQGLRDAADPTHDEQIGEVRRVVGVEVRDEDGIDHAWADAALEHAHRGAPTDVDEDVDLAAADDLCVAAAVWLVDGTPRAEENQFERGHRGLLQWLFLTPSRSASANQRLILWALQAMFCVGRLPVRPRASGR